MIKVCGDNIHNQLIKESNYTIDRNNIHFNTIIFPPLDIKNNSFLSCSFYYDHTAIITQEGVLQVIGDNRYYNFSTSLPKEVLRQLTELPLEDDGGNKLFPISVACNHYCTLLLVSKTATPNDSSRRLAFFSSAIQTRNPIFVPTLDHSPVALFAGDKNAAAIDAEGGITFMRYEVEFKTRPLSAPRGVLPDGEAAISVAFCDNFFVVAGSSGRVFVSQERKPTEFVLASELSGVNIKEVSGVSMHCFAVSSDGRVFGLGSNAGGRLGLGEEAKKFTKFIEIWPLKEYKIISASAGDHHSLFVTDEGKVFACGSNSHGQLPISGGPCSNYFTVPVATMITSGASFCITGSIISAIFIGEVPPNTPNRPICQTSLKKQASPSTLSKEGSVESKDEETESLLAKVSRLESENSKLREEISSMKKKQLQQETLSHHHQEAPVIELLDEETIQSLEKIKEIGNGGGGRVFEVSKRETYALKEMNVNNASVSDFKRFIGEYEIMNRLSHPNILKTYGIFMSDEKRPPSFLLEFCHSNLEQAVSQNKLSKVNLAFSVYQIAEGMKYVHWNKIIHRDLKPTNVLLSSDGTIKICDFGISKVMTVEEQTMTRGVGTQKYMAPEVMDEDDDYDEKVDVYSFGVLVFFALGGDVQKIKLKDIFQRKKPPIPGTFTEFARNLISRCWNFEPKDRPSFSEILDELSANHYGLVEMTESEKMSVEELIDKHKSTLPLYGA